MDIIETTLQAGFPVAVAAFLLLRVEKAMEELRDAIRGLQACQTCRFREGARGANSVTVQAKEAA